MQTLKSQINVSNTLERTQAERARAEWLEAAPRAPRGKLAARGLTLFAAAPTAQMTGRYRAVR